MSDPAFVARVRELIEREGCAQNVRSLQGHDAEINMIFCPLCDEQMTWRIDADYGRFLFVNYSCSNCAIKGYLAVVGEERRLTPALRDKIVQKVREDYG